VQLVKAESFKRSSLALPDLYQDQKIKVLVLYDGSENAEAALDDLSRAGLPSGVEALVVVTDVCLPSSPADISRAVADRRMMVLKAGVSSFVPALRDVEEERVMSSKAEHRLRFMFPRGAVKSESLSNGNSIRRGMTRRAEAWSADLIVVGAQTSPSPQITDYCGTAVEIAAQSHCSARIARPSNSVVGAPVRILIGIDGSVDANNCLRTAARRVWPKGSEVRVVLVPKPGPRIELVPDNGAGVLASDRTKPFSSASRVFDEGLEELRASGLEVSVASRDGLPVDVLIEEAREWGAGCIFVDALGFSRRVENAHDGPGISNVVKAVAIGAPCSVELVRGKPLEQGHLSPAA
jgi:nucleotide-binding universal stress UspA family protein